MAEKTDEELERAAAKRPKANLSGFVQNALTRDAARADEAQAEIQRRAEEAAAERGAAKRAAAPSGSSAGITFKKGGRVGSRGDGVAQRGKTRGKMR